MSEALPSPISSPFVPGPTTAPPGIRPAPEPHPQDRCLEAPVTVRFLHTSDWQLGMTRHYLAGEAQPRFTADRADAVRRVLELAQHLECAFVVVAGDVFDHPNLSAQDLGRALEAMGCAPVPLYLLPGNHDPLGTGSLWDAPAVADRLPPNVTLLRSTEAVAVAEGVEIVGAPWRSRKPDADPVAPALEGLEADGTVRIVVGHGMLEELEPDAHSPVTVRRAPLDAALADGRIHYVALGDRHIRWPPDGSGAIQYSGAHETTSFREPGRGQTLEVQIDPAAPPEDRVSVRDHEVGRWRHLVISRQLDGQQDIDALAAELDALAPKERTLVKTALTGGLTVSQAASLDAVLADRGGLFASLEAWERHTDLVVLPDDDELAELSLGGFAQQSLERLRVLAQPPTARADLPGAVEADPVSHPPEDPNGSPAPVPSAEDEEDELLAEPAAPQPHETAQDALRLLIRLSAGESR